MIEKVIGIMVFVFCLTAEIAVFCGPVGYWYFGGGIVLLGLLYAVTGKWVDYWLDILFD